MDKFCLVVYFINKQIVCNATRLFEIALISNTFEFGVEVVGMDKSNIKIVIMNLRVFLFRLLIVLLYSFFGAAVFYYLEREKGRNYQAKTANISSILNNAKGRLHENISSVELNRISQDLSNLAKEVNNTNHRAMGKTEQYFIWVYFCLTTIMTIGYGDITPKTNAGKLFLVFYSAPGISLMVLLLACFAKLQTALFHKLVKKLKRKVERDSSGNYIRDDLTVLILSVILLIPVGIIGVLVVRQKSNWSAINCVYYWFCTVTTIGFGDLVIPDHMAGTIVPWLLMKTLTLGVMAGVINSLTNLLQKRRLPKLRCSKKKLPDNNANEVEME